MHQAYDNSNALETPSEQLKVWNDGTIGSMLNQIERDAKDLLIRLGPRLIRLGAGSIPILGTELGNILGAYADEVLTGYLQSNQSAARYRSSLQALANSLREASNQKPIVVLTDELDRCRPSYAIELLETSKHIFGVDHVVFVLAVNRAEIAHSVKALYGIEFDAEGYLRRFFDFDFRLPSTDRRAFIRNMLSSIGVEEFIASNSDRFASGHSELVSETLVQFLGKSNLGLRSVEQAIHRLRAVLFSLGKNDCVNLKVLTVLTVLSAVEPALYRRFVEGEASAEETIGPFFSQINFAELRSTSSGVLVESVIIASKISRSSACLTAEDMQKEAPLLSPNPPMGGVKAEQIGMREPTREKALAPLGPM